MPINLNRALRTRVQMQELVEAVRDAPTSETETDHLEWKRQLDLTAKAALATIAKGVLGFANRDPARAERTFDGCAYFLAGVSPQRLDGVSPEDIAKIEAGVRVYAGDGPQWRADYVDVGSKTILVVTVEAPRQGDPIHAAAKSFHPAKDNPGPTLTEGAVLVRHGASTDPAKPTDIAMLSRRAAGAFGVGRLDLALELADRVVVKRVDLRDEQLARLVASERRRLEYPLTTAGRALGGQPTYLRAFSGEYRTAQEYRDEVEAYLGKFEEHLRERLFARAVQHEVGVLRLVLRNDTERTFSGVRVSLRVPGVLPLCSWKPEVKKAARLPTPPELFGHATRSTGGFAAHSRISLPDIATDFRGPWVPDVRWDQATADWVVDFSDEQVRPHGNEELPPLHVVACEDTPSEIEVAWEATDSVALGRIKGSLVVPISDEWIDAEVLLQDPEDEADE